LKSNEAFVLAKFFAIHGRDYLTTQIFWLAQYWSRLRPLLFIRFAGEHEQNRVADERMEDALIQDTAYSFAKGTQLADVSYFAATEWLKQGMITVQGGGVQGRRRRMGIGGVIALRAISELRERGLSREAIKPLSTFISQIGEAMMRRAVNRGCTIAVFEHEAAKPQLLTGAQYGRLPAGSVIAIDIGRMLPLLDAAANIAG
jgi:hypothetical protein